MIQKSALVIISVAAALLPFSASAWNYAWDDPVLYNYAPSQYATAYQAYQPYYQSQYQSYYPQQQYGIGSTPGIGYENGPYGYGFYGGYFGYGLAGAYGDKGPGKFTGDYLPWTNEPVCDYPGYGRGSCMYHPSQPLYDPWTGTWY